jgi:D-cysteine desulfhydrase
VAAAAVRAAIERAFYRALFIAMLGSCSDATVTPATPPAATKPPTIETGATPATPVSAAPAPASSVGKPMNAYPLFVRFPALGRALRRAPLGNFPTPVERARSLGEAIGVPLYIKRDDRSAEPYGGGKARKLELLLGQALADKHPEVITFGAVGSHHALATAIYARRLGLRTTLLFLPEPPSPDVRTILFGCAKQGAHMELVGTLRAAERRAAALVEAASDKPLILPAGGSSPLGNVGFVNAAFELSEQIDEGAMPQPHDVYMALGTMGSAVGLAIGFKALGLPVRVVAVRASTPGTSSGSARDRARHRARPRARAHLHRQGVCSAHG